jgi:hypothetical protein
MNAKIKEFQNKLQQLGWKGQGNEKDRVKDGGTRFNIMGIKNKDREWPETMGSGGKFYCKTKATTECNA